jgi:hypothetical protein
MMKYSCLLASLATMILLVEHPAHGQQMQYENTAQACQDGMDNDGDTVIDCLDQDCVYFVFCAQSSTGTTTAQPGSYPDDLGTEPAPPPHTTAPVAPPTVGLEGNLDSCKDGYDNDGDGLADCSDEDCWKFSFCAGGQMATDQYGQPLKIRKTKQAKGPWKTKGGIGIFTIIMMPSKLRAFQKFSTPEGDERQKVTEEAKVGGGFGLFGEKSLHAHFALGAEFHMAFAKPGPWNTTRFDAATGVWSGWSGNYKCTACERFVMFSIMLRMKIPFNAGKWVRLYPLLALGIGGDVVMIKELPDPTYVGLSYSLGFGAEFLTPVPVAPLLEVRYLGGTGWNAKMDEMIVGDYEKYINEFAIWNTMIITIGLRFL